MTEYLRFQPVGKALLGHTSEGSASSLPTGFVFAYDTPDEALGEWGPFSFATADLPDLEAISFLGEDAFDPGDAEGLAVRPVKELRRESALAWLKRQAKGENGNAVSLLEKIEDKETQ
jgi:hypothetical protein